MKTFITMAYILAAVITLIATSNSHATVALRQQISTKKLTLTRDPNAELGPEPTCAGGRQRYAEAMSAQKVRVKRASAAGTDGKERQFSPVHTER